MTDKTTPKTVRIDAEVAKWLKGKDARLLIESTCELVRAGKLRFDDIGVHTDKSVHTKDNSSGSVHTKDELSNSVHTKGSVYTEETQKYLDDIEGMVKASGGTFDEFVSDLDFKLTWEQLLLENGKIKQGELDRVRPEEMDNLEKLCREMCVDNDKAMREVMEIGAKIVYGKVQRGEIV